ncbi:peroxidase [Marchantia polymorpha subsp. ruderalis]|uniref:Plant heme peroxidase family profile domain-containing protein n=1 Tax=Marchantia polymorpha TaxID=3197 RepID=A0A2R6X1T1_MARPO|nr:hypothetical protein MARPO_0042s0098 [Marchantia polymorpha]BBN02367.1 hypothetical protein Mp_2g14750 [Marchantia polymorpha subsp. ruderalis]|eukprot:PTQ40063.1 hypothetical protein MARPO_0042s0098 [Marchantia polymorpha]
MASLNNLFLLLTWVLLLFMLVDSSEQASLLRDDFYKDSCPDAKSVIKAAGCDASVLLDGNDTEKTAPINSNLIGYDVVDDAKQAVEAICPGVVSCSDILAYAARDSTVKLNGTGWTVQGRRRDGLFSCADAAENELPLPTFNVSQLIESFARRGLSKTQMVILSGSHTVGVGHCDKFIERLYNFSATHFTDPSINASYAQQLKKDCPQAIFNTTLEIFMDTITLGEFDANYYKVLSEHKGLFTSDQSLERRFDHRFGKAMRAMGAVGVRAEFQVRRNCRTVNPC